MSQRARHSRRVPDRRRGRFIRRIMRQGKEKEVEGGISYDHLQYRLHLHWNKYL